ncbi:MAG: (2Fe-2S)-binding protein [Gaiellales bacterium]
MTLGFLVNGEERTFDGAPMTRLLDVLREEHGLTGTLEGCGEGECGACAVLLDSEIVCSCLVPVFQVEGREVRTIEGLGTSEAMDPLQEILVREGGVQCGACTPGIVLTLRALLDRDPTADRQAVREALAGNLCRCTGYERILRAVESFVASEGSIR